MTDIHHSRVLYDPPPRVMEIKAKINVKEMEIPDHLTCLLRTLYAGQEATVRTGHGATDWFQIGKGVQKLLSLIRSHLFIFVFISITLGGGS